MHIIDRGPASSSLRFHFQIFISSFSLFCSFVRVLFAKQCQIKNYFRTTIVINQVSARKYLFFIFSFCDISDRFGNFACPLYQDELPYNQQECVFNIESEGEQFSGVHFEEFWSHVRSVHPSKYDEILMFCRAQAAIGSSTITKVNILFVFKSIDE
jgi:hypothetical protein